jgi:hypothetical protein
MNNAIMHLPTSEILEIRHGHAETRLTFNPFFVVVIVPALHSSNEGTSVAKPLPPESSEDSGLLEGSTRRNR